MGDFVKDKACHSGWNEEWQSWDVDEDKVSLPLLLFRVKEEGALIGCVGLMNSFWTSWRSCRFLEARSSTGTRATSSLSGGSTWSWSCGAITRSSGAG